MKKKTDIKEFIKEKSPFKDHSESFGSEGYRIFVAAISKLPSYYCDVAIQLTCSFGYLQHTLVVTDAVGHRESYSYFIRSWHGINVIKSHANLACRAGRADSFIF
jgi:hypothetical protein